MFTRESFWITVCVIFGLCIYTSDVMADDYTVTPEQYCHVENIYHEARGEGWAGWALVKATVDNRVESRRWPSTVCGVVHQPYQFSWTLSPTSVTNMEIWNRIVVFVKEGQHSDFGGANHYHHEDINPYWAKSLTYLGQVGQHKYYK